MNKLIAITIGDIKGVGINLLIKLYNKKKINNFILFTNIEIFKKNIKFPFSKINLINDSNINNYNKKKLNIYSFETKNINTNTLDALNISYNFTKKMGRSENCCSNCCTFYLGKFNCWISWSRNFRTVGYPDRYSISFYHSGTTWRIFRG